MKVFIDTNVLLDVLAKRRRFYRDSVRIWSLAEQGSVCGLISAISFNNICYVVRKVRGSRTAVAERAGVAASGLPPRGKFAGAIRPAQDRPSPV